MLAGHVGLAPIAFPFLPRHLSITSTLTIGVPAFFLALARSTGAVRSEGFLRGLLAFCMPAGTIAALTIAAAYLLVRGPLDAGVIEGRTAAVLVATGMGLAIVVGGGAGPGAPARALVGLGDGGRLRPGLHPRAPDRALRDFFAVVRPSAATWWVCAGLPGRGHRRAAGRAPHPPPRAHGGGDGLSRAGGYRPSASTPTASPGATRSRSAALPPRTARATRSCAST